MPFKVPSCPLLGSEVGGGDLPAADEGPFDLFSALLLFSRCPCHKDHVFVILHLLVSAYIFPWWQVIDLHVRGIGGLREGAQHGGYCVRSYTSVQGTIIQSALYRMRLSRQGTSWACLWDGLWHLTRSQFPVLVAGCALFNKCVRSQVFSSSRAARRVRILTPCWETHLTYPRRHSNLLPQPSAFCPAHQAQVSVSNRTEWKDSSRWVGLFP